MRLRIIGSAGSYPASGTPASGYLVDEDDTTVWVDCGPGTFISMPIDPWAVDAIVVSHRHTDHCADLLAAFHAFGYSDRLRTRVPVYAAAGVFDALKGFVDPDDDHPFRSVFDFNEVGDGDAVTVGPIDLSFVLAHHSVPDVATRFVSDGRTLVYTGDTGPGDWDRVATDADLFLCEATYQGEPGTHAYPYHLTAKEAGEIARRRGVARLVMTHLPDHLDPAISVAEAAAMFDGELAVAEPGGSFLV